MDGNYTINNGQASSTQSSNLRPEHGGSVTRLAHQHSNTRSSLGNDEEAEDDFTDAQEHKRSPQGSTNNPFISPGQMHTDHNATTNGFLQNPYIDTRNNFTLERREELRSSFNNMAAFTHNGQSDIAPFRSTNDAAGLTENSNAIDLPTLVYSSAYTAPSTQAEDEDVEMGNNFQQSVAEYTYDEPYQPEGFTRGASTPPPEETPSLVTPASKSSNSEPSPAVDDANYPHAVKNLSFRLVMHQKLHVRCLGLKPNHPLAEHRYWIAVLSHTRKLESVKDEKHLIWMKGNRFTTVRTVWHYFQQASMTAEEIVLLHAGIKVKDEVMVQELDLWDDKFVVFRAVNAKSPEAKGKELAQGLVIEVVEID